MIEFARRTLWVALLTWAVCTIVMHFVPAEYVPFRYAGF